MAIRTQETLLGRRGWLKQVGAVAGGALVAGGLTPAEATGRGSGGRGRPAPRIFSPPSTPAINTSVYEAIPFGVFITGAPVLWAQGIRGDGVLVGVVDSGIDVRNIALGGTVTIQRDFVGDASSVNDWWWHGTHVAGTIAANQGILEGVLTGVAPNATLADYRVIGNTGTGLVAHAVAAINQAVEDGCHVLYLGFGADQHVPALQQAIRRALRHQVLVVAGGGDVTTGVPRGAYPGTYPDVVPVMAVNYDQNVDDYTLDRLVLLGGGPAAPNVRLAHDGGFVVSTAITPHATDPQYIVASGASMAAAHVAGMAALLVQKMNQRTGQPVTVGRLRAALETTGASLSLWLPSLDPNVGFATFYPEVPRRMNVGLTPSAADLNIRFQLPNLKSTSADSSNPPAF